MYNASIPVMIKTLGNLDVILDKAIAHAQARKSMVANTKRSTYRRSQPAELQGTRLPEFVDAAEFLLSRHHGLQAAAARRGGDRKDGFFGKVQ